MVESWNHMNHYNLKEATMSCLVHWKSQEGCFAASCLICSWMLSPLFLSFLNLVDISGTKPPDSIEDDEKVDPESEVNVASFLFR